MAVAWYNGALPTRHEKVGMGLPMTPQGSLWAMPGLHTPYAKQQVPLPAHRKVERCAFQPSVVNGQPHAAVRPIRIMSEPECPKALGLNAKQLESFIRDGYLVIWPTVPGGDAFHQQAYKEASRIAELGEVGNNLIADEVSPGRLLDPLLDAPEMVGALTSLLGEDYSMGLHRHCHMAKPGSPGQSLHQDDFHGFDGYRHHVPTEVMFFYYPQAVSSEMGPLAVAPGSQYRRRSGPAWAWTPAGAPLVEKEVTFPRAGACVIMNWHLWHRGTQQRGGTSVPVRYAFKFQFRRTRPLLPPPALLLPALAERNPFLGDHAGNQDTGPGESHDCPQEQHSLLCSAVWAGLSGSPLPARNMDALSNQCGGYRYAALAVASGTWCASEAFTDFLRCLVRSQDADRPGNPGGYLSENVWLSEERVDTRSEIAGALQLFSGYLSEEDLHLARTLARGVLEAIVQPMESLGRSRIHQWHADWNLEMILSLSRLLPVEDAIVNLSQFVVPPQVGRVQLRALYGIYDVGIRCGAPSSAAWQAAADKAQLEGKLMECIAWWQKWPATRQWPQQAAQEALVRKPQGPQGMTPIQMAPPEGPAMDCGGRYAMYEALRVLSRFGSQQSALEAVRLSGLSDSSLCSGDQWRQRLSHFIERRRRCPITSVNSAF
mmetsp:Transcript_42421/g.92431  ORF Transcript_42421/g.92431 Transcript_42421/m.92431 type:complete len:658 (-) Transcript_42421:547-2520(-)